MCSLSPGAIKEKGFKENALRQRFSTCASRTLGTALKSCDIRKFENHCSKEKFVNLSRATRASCVVNDGKQFSRKEAKTEES